VRPQGTDTFSRAHQTSAEVTRAKDVYKAEDAESISLTSELAVPAH